MKADSFSIVVPTHNRIHLVESLLQTLTAARSNFSGTVEILIIDSSENDNASVISQLCHQYQAIYFRCINNVCKKRNLGIQQAKSEFVFFTDSDCEIMPDTLTQHAQTYVIGGKDIGGVLGMTTIIGDTAPIWKTLKLDSSFTSAFSFARWLKVATWGTCTNISFRREVLEQVNGFDENWPLVVYGEDVDLGLRINEAGFVIQCNPQAVVKHNSATISSLKHVLRKKFQSGRADYFLGKKHPANLAGEFPGWPGIVLLLIPVLLLKSFLAQSILFVFWGFICLLAGILFQAVLTTIASKARWRATLHYAAVILFEALFESGRLFETFRHGQVHRLWTKFVYAERQLYGERDKRIRQMWACILALSCLWLFS